MRPKPFRYLILLLAVVAALAVAGVVARFWDTMMLSREPVMSFEQMGVTYYAYSPDPSGTEPAQATLVVLTGLGGDAQAYLRGFIPYAKRYNWNLLAPAFDYSEPTTLEREINNYRSLHEVATSLGTGGGRVLIYGFSRGSQTGHRFVLFYPDHVRAAALMSAGTYTLPYRIASGAPLNFPLGAADISFYSGEPFNEVALSQVPFWIGVGDQDNVAGDVPRTWDQYTGTNRLDRAKSFASALQAIGATVELHIFPGLHHQETSSTRDQAMSFLNNAP